jgi:hypothetical protein
MADIEVKEAVRRIVSKDGHELRLHNVTKLNVSGSWVRLESDEGYVIVNPANVLAFIVKGERVL